MQDYFKYDKIQTGTSLFMKSDSDGSKDKQDAAQAIGIRVLLTVLVVVLLVLAILQSLMIPLILLIKIKVLDLMICSLIV